MLSVFSQYTKFFTDWQFCNSVAHGKGKSKVTAIQTREFKWKLPRKGFYKLSTDGVWKGIDKAGGGGGIRRDIGTWFIGFSSKYNA